MITLYKFITKNASTRMFENQSIFDEAVAN